MARRAALVIKLGFRPPIDPIGRIRPAAPDANHDTVIARHESTGLGGSVLQRGGICFALRRPYQRPSFTGLAAPAVEHARDRSVVAALLLPSAGEYGGGTSRLMLGGQIIEADAHRQADALADHHRLLV